MKTRAKSGDIFVEKLTSGEYMFGRVLLDIKACFKSGIIEMKTSQLRSGSISYLVETYDSISEKAELSESAKVVIPGIVVDSSSFEDDTWKVIGNSSIDPTKVDFQEDIRYYSEKILLTRGEVMLTAPANDSRLKKFSGGAKMNSGNLFDCTLAILGKTELASMVNIENYDTRFADPELRKFVYGILGEDSEMSYYDFALKHSFDTARLYTNQAKSEKKLPATTDKHLLKGIAWSFIGQKYTEQQDFLKIASDDGTELPDGIVFNNSEIGILLEYTDEDDKEHKMEFVLKADNGKSFKAPELLFKIHNEVVEKLDDNDFHFFQGLTLLKKRLKINRPFICWI